MTAGVIVLLRIGILGGKGVVGVGGAGGVRVEGRTRVRKVQVWQSIACENGTFGGMLRDPRIVRSTTVLHLRERWELQLFGIEAKWP